LDLYGSKLHKVEAIQNYEDIWVAGRVKNQDFYLGEDLV